jgi:ankyrin repeat protein
MDTGFTRLYRPLADIELFLHGETISPEQLHASSRPSPRDVLLSTLAALPSIETPTAGAITKAIDDKLPATQFRMLLQRADAHDPAMVNHFDAQGFTPLTLASLKGEYEYVDLLLTCCRRIDVEQPDERGNTALILAAAKGNYGIVYRLLVSHADVTRTNSAGHTSLIMTLQCWDDQEHVRYSLALEAQLEVLKGMLAKGPKAAQGARAILEAAYREAAAHEQAETSRIAQILGKE